MFSIACTVEQLHSTTRQWVLLIFIVHVNRNSLRVAFLSAQFRLYDSPANQDQIMKMKIVRYVNHHTEQLGWQFSQTSTFHLSFALYFYCCLLCTSINYAENRSLIILIGVIFANCGFIYFVVKKKSNRSINMSNGWQYGIRKSYLRHYIITIA